MEDPRLTRRQFVRDSAIAAAALAASVSVARAAEVDKKKILSYNENMEYRRAGKTGFLVSAVALGGHWKRIETALPKDYKPGTSMFGGNLADPSFQKNRYDILTKCMEMGINHVDACTSDEVKAYSLALKGRRDKMTMACSWYEGEMRDAKFRTAAALTGTLEKGMKESGLDYVDLWRITMNEQSSRHTEGEIDEMMKALAQAKKSGKVRFTGFSSHDRPHIKGMIEKYPDVVDAICTPYTASTKQLPADSIFEALKKHDVGFFGIKPFASNSLFKGDSKLDNPNADEDDRRARLAIRYILCNPTISAPLAGLVNMHQVENAAKAVAERRKLDVAEAKELENAMAEAWAKLPQDYQWLKNWEYV
jgi:predicted aldo/keto reductase-like oxidoreductase